MAKNAEKAINTRVATLQGLKAEKSCGTQLGLLERLIQPLVGSAE